jgi:hypothetical protein
MSLFFALNKNSFIPFFTPSMITPYPAHSDRNDSTGFFRAVLIDWKLTVSNAIIMDRNPARIKYPPPFLTTKSAIL